MENLNIINCLLDKKLLGQFIKDPDTWKSWYTFLRAFFGLAPVQGDHTLYKSATGRAIWPTCESSEAWLIIGTRGGKGHLQQEKEGLSAL